MAKITSKDNLFDDEKTLYDEKGKKIGTQRKDFFGDGVSFYDEKDNKVSTSHKDLFGDGISTYDQKGKKIATTHKKIIGEGTVTYDTKGNKIAETEQDIWGNTYTETYEQKKKAPVSKTDPYVKSDRELRDEMDAQADAWLANMRANIPPKQNTFRETYSDASFGNYIPEETYTLNQVKDYFRFVGSFLLKNCKKQITTDCRVIEREDKHYYGLFNLLRRKEKNKVRVPQTGYWTLNHKEDSYSGGDEYVSEKNYVTETGITPEGKIIKVEFEEQYYTSWGVRFYHETYRKFDSHITEENISKSPGIYIAMVDHYLNGLKADMSFSKYLSHESACKPDDQAVAGYYSDIKKAVKEASVPEKIIDGRLNNWQWLALITILLCALCSVLFSDQLLIMYAVLIVLWTIIYPLSRFRFEKINPKADNYRYEIIILFLAAIPFIFQNYQMVMSTKWALQHGYIENNTWEIISYYLNEGRRYWFIILLFLNVCHVLCILGSIHYKKKNRKAENSSSREKNRKGKTITTILGIAAVLIIASFAGFTVWNKVMIPERKYKAAVEMMENGYSKTAFEELLALNGYKDSEDLAKGLYNEKKIQGLYNFDLINVGDSLYFGTYEQDNNLSNGKEFIEWSVLAKADGKVLLISRYSLDNQPYNKEGSSDVTWDTCSLRQWLNKDFIEAAFSPEDQNFICKTTVEADKNPLSGTKGGKKTTDKVFLLGISDIVNYYGKNEVGDSYGYNKARKCMATPYALVNGAADNGKGYTAYWLRTPQYGSEYGSIVSENGAISGGGGTGGINVSWESSVRPAIWITLGVKK